MRAGYSTPIRNFLFVCFFPFFLGGSGVIAATPDLPSQSSALSKPSAANRLVRSAPVPKWVESATLPVQASSQQPLTVRLADTQIYVDQQPTTYIHNVTQANEASMLSALGNIEITFQPDYQEVAIHSIRIIRGSSTIDKTQTADIRFLQREQELESGIYTGSVTASIVLDDIRVGDSVDIAYSISGQNPVFSGKFSYSSYWDSPYPIQRKRVTLNTPYSRQIYYKIIGQELGLIDTKEQRIGDRKIVRFQGEDLTAIDMENHVPSDIDKFRWIQFSEFKTWKEVSQWALNLFDVSSEGSELRSAIDTIGFASSPEKRIQNALAYVQNQIRYLSISMGENSHKPFPPDLVLARRYGDCKDKSLLLVKLLNRLGIEASPVLLSTTAPQGVRRLLPSPRAFDHAIVSAIANGKTYYLDPTRGAQFGVLENMGQAHHGAEVLVVKADSDSLNTIPESSPSEKYSDSRTERFLLNQMEGAAELSVVWKYTGLDSEMVRFYTGRQNQEALRRFYSSSIIKRYSTAEIKSGPVITDDRESNSISVEMHLRVPKFLEKLNNGWLIKYESSNLKERFFMPESPRRRHPLAVPNIGSISRYDLEIALPEEVDANYQPSETNIHNPAFNVKELLAFKGRTLRVLLDLAIVKDRVAPNDVDGFLADTRKFGEMLNGAITIRSSDMKSGAVRPVAHTPLKQRIYEKQNDVVAQSTIALTDAKDLGLRATDALCERGLAHARLGHKSDALNDISAALKTYPLAMDMVICRGEIYVLLGDMKSGEIDFSSAIAAGNLDAKSYFLRGVANYALKKWQDSEKDFERAQERYIDRDNKIRSEIMQTLSRRRGNAGANVKLRGTSAEAWPEIVLGAAEGSRNDDDVLRLVHQRIGDELEIALHDAYFYLGQINIINGNKLKASVYLQRSIDKGILTNPLRQIARMDVDRLRR